MANYIGLIQGIFKLFQLTNEDIKKNTYTAKLKIFMDKYPVPTPTAYYYRDHPKEGVEFNDYLDSFVVLDERDNIVAFARVATYDNPAGLIGLFIRRFDVSPNCSPQETYAIYEAIAAEYSKLKAPSLIDYMVPIKASRQFSIFEDNHVWEEYGLSYISTIRDVLAKRRMASIDANTGSLRVVTLKDNMKYLDTVVREMLSFASLMQDMYTNDVDEISDGNSDRMKKYILMSTDHIYLALFNNELVGVADCHSGKNMLHVSTFFLVKSFRAKGMGMRFYTSLLKKLSKESRVQYVIHSTSASNENMMRLSEKLFDRPALMTIINRK